MNKQEVIFLSVITLLLFTPMIFTAYQLYKIDKWFQQVEQRLDSAEKKVSKE